MYINQIPMVIQQLNTVLIFSFLALTKLLYLCSINISNIHPNDSNEIYPRQLGRQFTLGHKTAEEIFSL